MPRKLSEHGTSTSSIPANAAFQQVISACLQQLNSYSSGTAIYILSCLCPDDFDVILNLVRLDLSQPYQSGNFPEGYISSGPNSEDAVLLQIGTHTSRIPRKDYSYVWLDLTKGWLLTCPFDPYDYRAKETDEKMFRQKLRSELLDRILNIT